MCIASSRCMIAELRKSGWDSIHELSSVVCVAATFTRLVDSMSTLLGRGRDNSNHQFGCSSEDMEIHGWVYGFPQRGLDMVKQ